MDVPNVSSAYNEDIVDVTDTGFDVSACSALWLEEELRSISTWLCEFRVDPLEARYLEFKHGTPRQRSILSIILGLLMLGHVAVMIANSYISSRLWAAIVQLCISAGLMCVSVINYWLCIRAALPGARPILCGVAKGNQSSLVGNGTKNDSIAIGSAGEVNNHSSLSRFEQARTASRSDSGQRVDIPGDEAHAIARLENHQMKDSIGRWLHRFIIPRRSFQQIVVHERLGFAGMVIGLALALLVEVHADLCLTREADRHYRLRGCYFRIYPYTIMSFALYTLLFRFRLRVLYPQLLAGAAMRGIGRVIDSSAGSDATFAMAASFEIAIAGIFAFTARFLEKSDRSRFTMILTCKVHTISARRHQRQLDVALRSLLPGHVLQRMVLGEPVLDLSSMSVVSVCELVDFVSWSNNQLPDMTAHAINYIVNLFDQEVAAMGLLKVKAYADRYVCMTPLTSAAAADTGPPTEALAHHARSRRHDALTSTVSEGSSGLLNSCGASATAPGIASPSMRSIPPARRQSSTTSATMLADDGEDTAGSLLIDFPMKGSKSFHPTMPTKEATADETLNLFMFARKQLKSIRHLSSLLEGSPLKGRIAIHGGAAFGAVVGTASVGYDLFGPAISAVTQFLQLLDADVIGASEASLAQPAVASSIMLMSKEPLMLIDVVSSSPAARNPYELPTFGGVHLGTTSSMRVFSVAPRQEMGIVPAAECFDVPRPDEARPLHARRTSDAPDFKKDAERQSAVEQRGPLAAESLCSPPKVQDAAVSGGNTGLPSQQLLQFDRRAAEQRRHILRSRVELGRQSPRREHNRYFNASQSLSMRRSTDRDGDQTSNPHTSTTSTGHRDKAKTSLPRRRSSSSVCSPSSNSETRVDAMELDQRLAPAPYFTTQGSSAVWTLKFVSPMTERLYSDYRARRHGPWMQPVTAIFALFLLMLLVWLVIDFCRPLHAADEPFLGEAVGRHQLGAVGAMLLGGMLLLSVARFALIRSIVIDDDAHEGGTKPLQLLCCTISHATYFYADTVVLMLQQWVVYVAAALSWSSVINGDILFLYICFTALTGCSFMMFPFAAALPAVLCCNVAPFFVADYLIQRGSYLSNYIAVPILTFVAVYFAFTKEREDRQRFAAGIAGELQLQAARDDLALQQVLMELLFPPHVVETVVERISDLQPNTLQHGSVRPPSWYTTYMQKFSDIVVLQIRLDDFGACVAASFSDPAAALRIIDATFLSLDDVLSRARLLRRLQLMGDVLMLVGPLSEVSFEPDISGPNASETISARRAGGPSEAQRDSDVTSARTAFDALCNIEQYIAARVEAHLHSQGIKGTLHVSPPATAMMDAMPNAERSIRVSSLADVANPDIEVARVPQHDKGCAEADGLLQPPCALVFSPVGAANRSSLFDMDPQEAPMEGQNPLARQPIIIGLGSYTAVSGSMANSARAAAASARRLRTREERGLFFAALQSIRVLEELRQLSHHRRHTPHIGSGGARTSTIAAVAVVGGAHGVVVGLEQASFDVVGVAPRRCTALMHAAPQGFIGVGESLVRVLCDLGCPYLPFASAQMWRVRGVGSTAMHSLLDPFAAEQAATHPPDSASRVATPPDPHPLVDDGRRTSRDASKSAGSVNGLHTPIHTVDVRVMCSSGQSNNNIALPSALIDQ